MEGIVLLMLVGFGVEDMRRQSLPVPLLLVVFVAAVILRLFFVGDVVQGIAGSVAGGIVCVIGKISRGQIGSGDGFLLMVTGILLGFWENMELLLAGLFFCALFSAAALVLWKKGRKYRVPFVPFLAAAQVFRIFVLL